MDTTVPHPGTTSNLPELSPADLSQLQKSYGDSCSKYEQLTEKKLQKSDTLIVSGFGCALRVKNDALSIFPGKTHAAQTQGTITLYRGVHGIRQVILLSDKGLVTLDALKWAMEQDISINMLDGHGNLLSTLSPEHESDVLLRRAQYKASTSLGVSITRGLIQRKTLAQIETLKTLPERKRDGETIAELIGKKIVLKDSQGRLLVSSTRKLLEDGLADLPHMNKIGTIQALEGRLAHLYWDVFVDMPLNWQSKDAKIVPPHWLVITGRTSSLPGSITGRHATNPYHAVLNYAYAILQSQCRQALVSQGFDTACGFLHNDKLHRDSLVFDLMECHRAQVDRVVLTMFASHTLSKAEFMSTPDGSVQFNPQFARYIAATCKIEQDEIDLSAEWLKGEVMKR